MDVRRATYGAAVRLAVVFSAMAAVVAVGLDAVGDVSTGGLVTAVAGVGFWMSWVQSGKVTRRLARRPMHSALPLR